jgi:acyl transferase domain-containing protein
VILNIIFFPQLNESIEYLLKKNLRIFVEIGPGRVLYGLVKRIALKNGIKDVSIFNTSDWDDIINLGSFLKEKGLTNDA